MMLRCLGAAAALLTLGAAPAAALTVGQVDDFEDGTTGGWGINLLGAGNPPPAALPVNVASGGPDGADDNFLLLTSVGGSGGGSRLTALNDAQWAGDYLAAGVGAVAMWVKNFGTSDLLLRLLLEDPAGGPPTNFAFSSDPIVVASGGGWQRVRFSLDPADLTAGIGSVEGALSGATVLRLFHGSADSFPGEPLAAQLGVDDITALGVPEPSAWALMIAGFGLAGAALRRRRLPA